MNLEKQRTLQDPDDPRREGPDRLLGHQGEPAREEGALDRRSRWIRGASRRLRSERG